MNPRRELALLGTFDAARLLGITPAGVRWLARTGVIRCERTLGGRRLFRLHEVEQLVVERARRNHPALAAVRPRMVKAGAALGQLSLPMHLGRRKKAKDVLHLGEAEVLAFRRNRSGVA